MFCLSHWLLQLAQLCVVLCDGHDSEDSKQSTADMSAFVQNLLQQMVSCELKVRAYVGHITDCC
ncbi:hypothetical protein Pyn_33927 [Prunus yedoensis var. nudiflora]|uniref:Secreted protein n=1 Tax=Prunus yedoensis var. nudiflora TaxID=2094558 RepID=A0A314Y7D7_PRUYE|nr:hypothetical protein Pyn_33927 [Prunus yedoensis var. nudiflora]